MWLSVSFCAGFAAGYAVAILLCWKELKRLTKKYGLIRTK